MREIKWERIGKLATVSVWKADRDFNLDEVKEELSQVWKNVIEINDFYIAFTDTVYFQGYDNFLEDYEELTNGKERLIKKAEWLEGYADYLKTIEHIILSEKECKDKIAWKNELQKFNCEYELKLLNEGIVRECRYPDGKTKKVAQGAEIFKMFLCKIDKGIIVFDNKVEEGYLFLIHYTKGKEKILLKFYLRKWGWYLFFDKKGRRFLLNELDKIIEKVSYVNKEGYKFSVGRLYPD
ncbi:MAG: hypothetical protein QXG39_03415 [Candidatus Aenigmatarchaeota archaeon]